MLLPGNATVRFVADTNPSDDTKESGSATLSYYAWDGHAGSIGTTLDVSSAGNRGGATSVSSNGLTASISIAPRNDAPQFASSALNVNEHATVHLSGAFTNDGTAFAGLAGNLKLYDPDNTTAQILYRVEQLPTNGTLTLGGAQLVVGSLFAQTDVANIVYTPTVGELTADTTDSVYFTIRDGAGGIIGTDAPAGTVANLNTWAKLDINIRDVNAQIAVSGNSVTLAENNNNGGAAVIAAISLSMSDADDPGNLERLTITSLPTATWGTLQYWNGSAYADVTVGNRAGLSFTQAQLTDGTHPALQFSYKNNGEPSATYDANGIPSGALVNSLTTSFGVHVTDNHAGGLAPTTADSTVTVTVNAVNDPPVLTTHQLGVGHTGDTTLRTDVVINDTQLTTTDPDSLAANRTFTVRIDPTRGYLTLNGTRIGRGATFTEADLSSGNLKYTCNDNYYYGTDSMQVFATDGDGGTSNIGTLNISIANPSNPLPGGGTGISGSLAAVVPESQFTALDQWVLYDNGLGASFTVDSKPLYGDVYRNGVKLIYGASGTTFNQSDITAGHVVYVNDGSEPQNYTSAFHDTISVTAAYNSTTVTKTITLTVTPVDDAPTITQTTGSVSTNQVGGTLMEQNADGSDGVAAANALANNTLTGIVNAVQLTTDNFQYHDVDNSSGQLTYYVSGVVGGTVRLWNGSAWNSVSSFSVADLAAGNVAYFHSPGSDVSSAGNPTMTGSVSVYLADGATIETGDVTIASGNITEGGSLTVNDGQSAAIHITKDNIAQSPTRTVTFTVANVNDAPTKSNTSFTVTEYSSGFGVPPLSTNIQYLDTSIISAADSDTVSSHWIYTLTALPTHGKIQQLQGDGTTWSDLSTNATFTYANLTAGNAAIGKLRYVNTGAIVLDNSSSWSLSQDSFKWKVNDGETTYTPNNLDSSEATVSIYLRPTNQRRS